LVEQLLTRISYIGPLREYPRRFYEISGEMPEDVGIRGEFAPEIIYRRNKTELIQQEVSKWLKKFNIGHEIQCESSNGSSFSLYLKRTCDSPSVNIADTGFGSSQILPLIVQGLFAEKDHLIIAEQPEIHLNPKLQVTLADLFCEIAKSGRGVMIETHSEHLVLRIRRLVAENVISANDVAVYYVEKKTDRSTIREVPIQKNGHIDSEDWPQGFFEDSLKETLGLVSSQAKRND
jgi:predicted ATP-dependent endonuclease of OLD family